MNKQTIKLCCSHIYIWGELRFHCICMYVFIFHFLIKGPVGLLHFLRCFFTLSLPVRNVPYSLRVADFLISAVNSFWHFLLSPLQRLQLWNVNRFFIFQYYWFQRYYCGEQVETKVVWVIALHVRMCLRSALPSLDPQPACFSFTVQVFACILTPL